MPDDEDDSRNSVNDGNDGSDSDDSDVYEVEAVIDRKNTRGGLRYYIKVRTPFNVPNR